jgi:hypothetical protein
MSLITRTAKGEKLTIVEMDDNLTYLESLVTINSVSGLDTDTSDPLNPIVKIKVDSATMTGQGTQASPLSANIIPVKGSLIGGGILIDTWEESGIKKGLIASLTNLSAGLPYTIPSKQSTLIGSTAQSNNSGLANTNAIIEQTGSPATTAYAAGIARLYLGGGYTDWYLPTNYELYLCYSAALVVNKLLGADGFTNNYYWASTEYSNTLSWYLGFNSSSQYTFGIFAKSNNYYVRAVRTHTF